MGTSTNLGDRLLVFGAWWWEGGRFNWTYLSMNECQLLMRYVEDVMIFKDWSFFIIIYFFFEIGGVASIIASLTKSLT